MSSVGALYSANAGFPQSEAAFGRKCGGLGQRPAQRAVGKPVEGVDRRAGIGSGAGERLGQRAAAFEDAHRPVEVAGLLLAVLESAAPERALLGVAAGKGDDDRQGDLAVAEIIANRLAKLGLLRREIEHVVDQLI